MENAVCQKFRVLSEPDRLPVAEEDDKIEEVQVRLAYVNSVAAVVRSALGSSPNHQLQLTRSLTRRLIISVGAIYAYLADKLSRRPVTAFAALNDRRSAIHSNH